jgi:hypothetical protein
MSREAEGVRQDAQGRWVTSDAAYYWNGQQWLPSVGGSPVATRQRFPRKWLLIGLGGVGAILVLMIACTALLVSTGNWGFSSFIAADDGDNGTVSPIHGHVGMTFKVDISQPRDFDAWQVDVQPADAVQLQSDTYDTAGKRHFVYLLKKPGRVVFRATADPKCPGPACGQSPRVYQVTIPVD